MAQMGPLFAKLMTMGSELQETMMVAILLSSLIGQVQYALIIALINTLPENMAIWNYVSIIFIEKSNGLKISSEGMSKTAVLEDSCHAAAMTRQASSWKRSSWRPGGRAPTRRFRSDKPGHFSRACKSPERGGAVHDRRQSKEKSNNSKSNKGDEWVGDQKFGIARKEKRSFATVREMESENNNHGFHPNVVVDSGASEHVVSDELYLTDVEENTPVTVEWANGSISVTTTKRRNAELDSEAQEQLPAEHTVFRRLS